MIVGKIYKDRAHPTTDGSDETPDSAGGMN